MFHLLKRISITLLLILFTLSAEWKVVPIEPGGFDYYSIGVGDGRNDGINRVYGGTRNGQLVEQSFEDGNWSVKLCATYDTGPQYYNQASTTTVADGRGDGVNRVYIASQNGFIYEFSYNEADDSWSYLIVGGSNGWVPGGADIGTPRNDGVTRVVGTGYMATGEFTWSGTEWKQTNIITGNFDCWAVNIGDGRGDGVQSIYTSDGMGTNHCLREYIWHEDIEEYVETVIEAPTQMIKTAIGDGRGDGVNRVYGSGRYGHIYEFSFQDSEWSYKDIQDDAPLLSRYGLELGKNINNQPCLFSTAQGGVVREHIYVDDKWEDNVIDATSGATINANCGDGRNNGQISVYGSGETVSILTEFYEIGSDIDENYQLTIEDYHLENNYPNPFNPQTRISYQLLDNSFRSAKIIIYNGIGQNIGSYPCENLTKNGDRLFGEIIFDGSKLNSGVYHYSIVIDGVRKATKSMMLVK